MRDYSKLTIDELVRLTADDPLAYEEVFFPETARMPPAEYHKELWDALEAKDTRLLNVLMPRDSAKTTKLRLFTARRLSYRLGRTILYVAKSQGHAERNVSWLQTRVTRNKLWARVFGLRPGTPFTPSDCQIIQELPNSAPTASRIIALGVEGSVRGVNIEDYRPDLIILDDLLDDENAATAERREKMQRLIYGALINSLAPRSEAPHARLVSLNTPQHSEDYTMLALDDKQWKSLRFTVWRKGDEGKVLEARQSAWPERHPTQELISDFQYAIARNRASTWIREKECRVTSVETSALNINDLQFYEHAPEQGVCFMYIDPVPPPSERALATGLANRDYEAFAIVRRHKGQYYVLDYRLQKGHDPSWTVDTFFSLCETYRPFLVGVETVAYQATLAWILRKAMQERRRYFTIREDNDRRSTYHKIVDPLRAVMDNQVFYVKKTQIELISALTTYPDVAHDDLLIAVAKATQFAQDYVPIGADANSDVLEDDAFALARSQLAVVKVDKKAYCP